MIYIYMVEVMVVYKKTYQHPNSLSPGHCTGTSLSMVRAFSLTTKWRTPTLVKDGQGWPRNITGWKYVCVCVKNITIFYIEFTRKIILFSLFTTQFFIRKIHKHPVCKQGWTRGSRSKIWSFEWTYFLNDAKVFLLQLRSTF